MFNLNRRQFLLQTTLAIAATVTYAQAQDRQPTSPGALPKGLPRRKVVIVGAGISGLVAAYELTAVGHDVTILEARKRIGGRVFTLRKAFQENDLLELGASRIPLNHHLTLGYIKHFGLRLSPFAPTTGKYITIKDGKRLLVAASELLQNQPQIFAKVQKMTDGFDRLPQAFARSLTEKIKLDESVTQIVQTANGVEVSCSSGQKYLAESVLCTVPLTVLNRIAFSPDLSPAKKQAAAGGYNYRAATRCFVQFPARFWEKDNLNGWGFFEDEELWHTTWDRPEKTGILHAYLKGEKALKIDGFEGEAQQKELLKHWEQILPGVSNYSSVRSHFHSWTKDVWSKGGWAYPTDEQEKQLFSELGKSEGQIYFAGDHTSKVRGWLQGALESGLNAAKEIHLAGSTVPLSKSEFPTLGTA
jgi:monoamine oxidase